MLRMKEDTLISTKNRYFNMQLFLIKSLSEIMETYLEILSQSFPVVTS